MNNWFLQFWQWQVPPVLTATEVRRRVAEGPEAAVGRWQREFWEPYIAKMKEMLRDLD
jgi:hypothetical protein